MGRMLDLKGKQGKIKMPALEDAIKAVVDAVDALEAATAAEPTVTVDPLRTVVEAQLVAEGWTAPAPAEPAPEAPAE